MPRLTAQSSAFFASSQRATKAVARQTFHFQGPPNLIPSSENWRPKGSLEATCLPTWPSTTTSFGRTTLVVCGVSAIRILHSRSQQRSDQRVSTLTFLALKKPVFFPRKKYFPNFFHFFHLYSMQLFRADPTIFSKKKIKFIFCP